MLTMTSMLGDQWLMPVFIGRVFDLKWVHQNVFRIINPLCEANLHDFFREYK